MDKHLKHFAELANIGSKELRGAEHLHWISVLDTESGNFEKGILRAIESSNTVDGFKLVGSLSYYWQLRGHISEAIRWLEEITKKVPEVIDSTYCRIISHKGNFYRFKSDFEKAGKFLNESLNLSREIGDEIGVTDTLNRMGIYEFDRGRFEEAAKYYEENLEIFKKNGDKIGISKTLNNLGNASSNLGDDDKAMKLYEESLELRRELNDRLGIAITSNNIGILAFERGEFDKADELLEESVQVRRKWVICKA
ncbi:MAG: tetratricopeptide repeat protein [Ignavibacteria bacterium]|nr:tetratricopeptide repeat protein [Ignavibacteria bacterium]